jgi:hypothetical protein
MALPLRNRNCVFIVRSYVLYAREQSQLTTLLHWQQCIHCITLAYADKNTFGHGLCTSRKRKPSCNSKYDKETRRSPAPGRNVGCNVVVIHFVIKYQLCGIVLIISNDCRSGSDFYNRYNTKCTSNGSNRKYR